MGIESARQKIERAARNGSDLVDLSREGLDSLALVQLIPDLANLTSLTELGLSHNQLSTLPVELGNLTSLTTLDLIGNQLSTLPVELGNLTSLTTLDLIGNQLSTLPVELGNLTSLTRLDLIGNQLSTLPVELGNLTSLTTLYLSGNQLSTLPVELGNLTSLTRLGLSGNQLSTLPVELGNLTSLTELGLSHNQLSTLPVELGNLTSLTTLDLRGNQLSTLPVELGNLTSLTTLDLRGNQLSTLPVELGNLTSLTTLGLSDNRLSTLPVELGNLTSLTTLGLTGNQLSTLPVELGNLTSLTALYLSGNNQLSTLPVELTNLTSLTTLDLRGNQLNTLPVELGNLTSLTALYLRGNRLSTLPMELGNLTSLTTLDLRGNQLSTLPVELTNLTSLTTLDLSDNQLNTLPVELGNLTSLTALYLRGNRLSTLPMELGNLTSLTTLDLSDNQLSTLPVELGNLTSLTELGLRGNPWISPPPEVINQGLKGILKFLRSKATESSRQWMSKLLVVGEGGVGKTQLIRSLLGEEFEVESKTTEGISIRPVPFPHPSEEDINIHLKAWDFGGQSIYHATHQFFLSNRSLFIVVWNPRMGYEQCKLFYWLDTIKSLAPDSPVMIVATHIDERTADLPYDELVERYPNIAGEWSVSNKDRNVGGGVENLRRDIIEEAIGLPLMGEPWPTSWLHAADRIRAQRLNSRKITAHELWELMDCDEERPVPEDDRQVLAKWLHDLGDILYFHDDQELKDTVILDPHWVTQKISDVLVSDLVAPGLAILTTEAMHKIWNDKDIDEHAANRLLRLMENFDLSYRIPDDQYDRSLVVEKLSEDKAPYETIWDAHLNVRGCKEISMTLDLGQKKPAGIPTWFIARSHRFTQGLHWLHGALFGDKRENPRHLALVLAPAGQEHVSITVRGPNPHAFFVLLRDGLELTLARFPGLKDQIIRSVPCPDPEHLGCKSRFRFEDLERRLALEKPRKEIECPECLACVSVTELLFGISQTTENEVLDRLNEVEEKLIEKVDGTREQISSELAELSSEVAELQQLTQRQFLSLSNSLQHYPETMTPRVFTLRAPETKSWRVAVAGIWQHKWQLQLYCEAPGHWHPPGPDLGLYNITKLRQFFRGELGKWIKRMVGILKYAAPIAGPTIAYAFSDINEVIKNDVKLMTALVKKFPEFAKHDDAIEQIKEGKVSLTPLRQLLMSLDPDLELGRIGGLTKTRTPEGHYLWLCDHHRKEVLS